MPPEHGQMRLDKLMEDMFEMELSNNVKLLPDIARNQEDIKIFSQQEECDYLMQNGMHNKKER